ncbi:type I-C CRISPR-associated protein Cas8c/Csd1 [uncultured Mailhella sp.]|uniref:type I-C CRISPR-associated protein Cas8c/Csd1 n=1 Tax=uncultured Mailhella sp. TaxID=1981031 RepID=UPI00262216FF|nr:type I-C CRISPR-associated protein Cas8c/Csd1 [uncultured Mailhella sp.]
MLKDLCLFQERLSQDPASGMPPEGMSAEYVSFILEISEEGDLCAVHDLRNSEGKPVRCFVPAAVKRTVNVAPNFLWDNTGYVLGVSGKDSLDKLERKREAFRNLHQERLASCQSVHARALLAFLDRWTPERFNALDNRDALLDSNVVFRLKGEKSCLHEQEDMRRLWLDALSGDKGKCGVCLVTGKHAAIALTHPAIKGVVGGQSSGTALVSFNCHSFESYGKEQNANAPVCGTAAREYTAALNYLLQREHRQIVRIGDTSIVFWAEKATPAETLFGGFWAPEDNEQQDGKQVGLLRNILEALRNGRSLHEADRELDPTVRFFVLGLAPNAARLSVRFWVVDTLEVLLRHFNRWYEELYIERQFSSDPRYPPLWRILQSAAAQGKTENIPPELAGQLSRSILTGSRYPENMYLTILQRIHADKKADYFRAAFIKAYLCRNHHEEHDMTTLNTDENNIGYRLGRLFAVLEKAQKDALGGKVNAPLRERYIGAASATPRLVFPLLLRLAQHHVTKVKKNSFSGYDVSFTKTVADIMGSMTDFPAVLSLADQGRFMLGYYHQNNANYQKKNETSDLSD